MVLEPKRLFTGCLVLRKQQNILGWKLGETLSMLELVEIPFLTLLDRVVEWDWQGRTYYWGGEEPVPMPLFQHNPRAMSLERTQTCVVWNTWTRSGMVSRYCLWCVTYPNLFYFGCTVMFRCYSRMNSHEHNGTLQRRCRLDHSIRVLQMAGLVVIHEEGWACLARCGVWRLGGGGGVAQSRAG